MSFAEAARACSITPLGGDPGPLPPANTRGNDQPADDRHGGDRLHDRDASVREQRQ